MQDLYLTKYLKYKAKYLGLRTRLNSSQIGGGSQSLSVKWGIATKTPFWRRLYWDYIKKGGLEECATNTANLHMTMVFCKTMDNDIFDRIKDEYQKFLTEKMSGLKFYEEHVSLVGQPTPWAVVLKLRSDTVEQIVDELRAQLINLVLTKGIPEAYFLGKQYHEINDNIQILEEVGTNEVTLSKFNTQIDAVPYQTTRILVKVSEGDVREVLVMRSDNFLPHVTFATEGTVGGGKYKGTLCKNESKLQALNKLVDPNKVHTPAPEDTFELNMFTLR